MVLLSFKHLIFTKKSILIGLLSLCVIVTGCDKKSERRRDGKKISGGKEHVTKADPKHAQQDELPCIPPQVDGQVPPGQNNNQGANAQNPQVAAVVDPNAPKVATTTPSNGPKRQVPCVPGQQPQRPSIPGSNNNGSTSVQQDGSDTQTHNPVLVGSETKEKNNNSGSNAQTPKGAEGKGSQTNPHALPNLDLKGSSEHATDDEDSNVSKKDKDGDETDEEDKGSDVKGKKSKYTKQVKQLLDILEQLDAYYKNAMWTVTQDRYYSPNNFFSLLKSRLGKRINTKNLLIKVDDDYIEESTDHSCTGTAFELQIDTDREIQKLFVYDCRDERLVDNNSPVLTFKNNKKSWRLDATIHGLQQVMGDESLGFLITIANDPQVNPIMMKPTCLIKILDEDDESVKVKSASCKYWGQQFTSHESGKETFLFEEFLYDSEGDNELSVKARSLNLNEENQLCYANQIDTLAKKYESNIHIMDGKDDKGAACTKPNKDLSKNGNQVGQPQTQNLVAVQPQNKVSQPNINTDHQLVVPQTLHPVQSQQQANPFNQANQLSPMDQQQANQPNEYQDPQIDVVNNSPVDAVAPGYETDPNSLGNNAPQAFNPNGNQNMIIGEDGVERPDTTVDVNPNQQQAPPVVYRQPRGRRHQQGIQQNTENVAPPVNENYYEGQQMDFSSEAPPQQSY